MKQLYVFFLLLSCVGYTQVGINTPDPEETLHVAGDSATVMLEGLNAENNYENKGEGSFTRVFANAEGDLVLGDADDNINFILDEENYIPDNMEVKVVQTGTGENFTKIDPSQYNFPSFTIDDDAILEVNYSISWKIIRNDVPKRIQDDGARTVKTTVFVYDEIAGEYLDETYALTAQFYANGEEYRGAYEYFYSSGSDYMQLPPGTYTIVFGGLVGAHGNDNIFARFGGDKDQLQLIVYY